MITRLANFVQGKPAANRFPDPADLIQEPPVPARLTRLPDDRLRLEWQWESERVAIYAGTDPDAGSTDQPAAVVTDGKTAVLFSHPPWPRPYFTLCFYGGEVDGRRLVVAERVLSLPHTFNLRDVGGYETKEGRVVRWGQVYRSATLARLKTTDQERLRQLNVRLVCDLRSTAEVEAAPDRLPPGVAYLHQPLMGSESMWQQLRALRRYRGRYEGLLRRIYTQTVLDDNAAALGSLLRRLADPAQRPALIHCAVGKDRTGVTAAVLLALLGVPDEAIAADYTLSNRFHCAIYATMRPELQRSWWAGIRPSDLFPVALAQPQTMQAALRHLRQQYGGVETYVREVAGVESTVIHALREQLLQ